MRIWRGGQVQTFRFITDLKVKDPGALKFREMVLADLDASKLYRLSVVRIDSYNSELRLHKLNGRKELRRKVNGGCEPVRIPAEGWSLREMEGTIWEPCGPVDAAEATIKASFSVRSWDNEKTILNELEKANEL